MGYRGQQVFNFIIAYAARRGDAPSYGIIADELDMTRAHVCHAIRRLERRGYLQRRAISERKRKGWHEPVIVLSERAV